MTKIKVLAGLYSFCRLQERISSLSFSASRGCLLSSIYGCLLSSKPAIAFLQSLLLQSCQFSDSPACFLYKDLFNCIRSTGIIQDNLPHHKIITSKFMPIDLSIQVKWTNFLKDTNYLISPLSNKSQFQFDHADTKMVTKTNKKELKMNLKRMHKNFVENIYSSILRHREQPQ